MIRTVSIQDKIITDSLRCFMFGLQSLLKRLYSIIETKIFGMANTTVGYVKRRTDEVTLLSCLAFDTVAMVCVSCHKMS